MRVLSLGAGVQSSTLLLMAVEGEEQIDRAVFADTQWEPAAVYQHLEYLMPLAERAGIPIDVVTAGNIREDALNKHSAAWLPVFGRNRNGAVGMLKRQCTTNYKIRPIRRHLRALGATARNPVDQLIGISIDEAHRMRDSGVRYARNVYPLVERRMSRADCLAWLARHGYQRPPKSSCIGCPFRGDRLWRRMRDHHPDEWADVVAFDAEYRARRGERFDVFLHRSLKPLDQVDLSDERDRGQLDLFDAECFGVCGV